ncbi:MAG: chromate transporter [Bacilli bacterium]|nr:chromate transporter [Bacilli bacterium]MCH4201682.1 chromate transporter [Bacilli bacterium]MCH4235264.1 chromate transporter [Bacilli bacterium]
MEKLTRIKTLFFTFLKIGLFTFGGGYAMIPLIQSEITERHKWMTTEDIFNIIVIAESTPGPISVNSATYVGYKVAGFWGALFATLGLITPSFIIIYIISLFLDKFLAITIVNNAFLGIQAAVAILIIDAGITLGKKMQRNFFSIFILLIAFTAQILINVFEWNFSSIYFIIIGLTLGLLFYGLINNTKRGVI